MATGGNRSATKQALALQLVESGRFTSIDAAVEAALEQFEDWDDEIDPDAEADALLNVSPEDREAIREGLRDFKEGRVLTAEQVFGELHARFGAPRS